MTRRGPFKGRPKLLRTRFTLAVAAAVAAVTLAITAVAFFVIRNDLRDQLQSELTAREASVLHLARHLHGQIPAGWVPPESERFGADSPYTQVVTSEGIVWAPAGDLGLLPQTAGATAVAAGSRDAYYSDATLGGVHAMVLTAPLAPGLALQLAVPLNIVDQEVTSVGATLALLSVAGIGLAALTGWAVARAGLAPLSRLAAVAEQVTATGDPGERVDVTRPDELGRLATSFNTMLGALQRSLAAQRQLVSDAGHELRTPLTSMRLNIELLASDPSLPEEERQQILDRVAAQGAELGTLVANVTELARGEALDREYDDVWLPDAVRAGLDSARRDWPATAFPAHLEPCVAFGDAERIRGAVRNLLDNAAKFSPPGEPVEVRLRDGELTVRDHGPGIAADDLPYVFNRFYRAPSARSVPGSGLGLSIVRQVAESHGGDVEAEAPPGGGTLIRFRLPVKPPVGPAAPAPFRQQRASAPAG
jgi:two-component system, OmpR family, sensor histidine kinase MprB